MNNKIKLESLKKLYDFYRPFSNHSELPPRVAFIFDNIDDEFKDIKDLITHKIIYENED